MSFLMPNKQRVKTLSYYYNYYDYNKNNSYFNYNYNNVSYHKQIVHQHS